jgi:hypothetical protein
MSELTPDPAPGLNADQPPKPTPDQNQEQRILSAVRRTLTAIIRDVTPPPGMRHPLREGTIEDLRQCLSLIAARERELADDQGRRGGRPYYADEPQTAVAVPSVDLTRRGH